MMRELVRLGNSVTAVTVYSRYNDLTEETPYKVRTEHVTTPRLIPAQWAVYKILRKHDAEADIFHIDGQYIHGAGLYRLLGGRRPLLAYLIRPPLIKEEYVSWFFEKRYGSKHVSVGGILPGHFISLIVNSERFPDYHLCVVIQKHGGL